MNLLPSSERDLAQGNIILRPGMVGRPQEPVRYAEPSTQALSDDVDLSGLFAAWRILARRKGMLVLFSFAGALAAFLVTLPQTPIYQARALLEIQGLNENFLNIRELSPTSNSGVPSPEYDIQTQVRILQSESLLERVIDKMKIGSRQLDDGSPSRLSSWRKALGMRAARPASTHDEALSMVARNLKVRAQVNTRLVEIIYTSPDPAFSANVANTLCSEYIEQNVQARYQATENTGEWLQRQMADLKVKLRKSEQQLQEYGRSAGLLFTAEKDNVSEEKLRQVQQELSKAQAERATRQSKYELAMTASPDTLPEVLDDPILKDYQVKLTDLRRQLAEALPSFTADHPKVKKLQAQIAAVEQARELERANVVRRVENEFQGARRRESLLAADYAANARVISEQATKIAYYNILKREVESSRQLYETMLQRVNEASVASAMRASNIRVVDSAKPPHSPYRPSFLLNSVLGLMAGAFFGIVFVVISERADRSIQAPGDTQFYLNVPEIGVVPSAEFDTERIHWALPLRFKGRASMGTSTMAATPQRALGERFELVTWQRKPSVFAESFRSMLASILLDGNNGDRPHVLLLSSANPQEGKTSVISNLAIALAEANQRVLLVDGDLRRPRLHEVFELENTRGLADILRQLDALNGPLKGAVQQTLIRNLWVLPSGATESITDLIYSPRLPELIQLLRREFEFVLIDSPPVLQLSDARVLARYADAVILVIRAQQTTRDNAVMMYQRFSLDGARVLGTILNDWNPLSASSYGYYQYYDRYHRYHSKNGG